MTGAFSQGLGGESIMKGLLTCELSTLYFYPLYVASGVQQTHGPIKPLTCGQLKGFQGGSRARVILPRGG